MESKEYSTYSGRAKAGERPQQSLLKNNQFHGYRSTKQWVEEASQQCRGGAIYNAEGRQQNDGAIRALTSTPSRAANRKKDGRGVRFKQENEQSASRLESKVRNQATSLSPAILRKDCFPDSQVAALSPISLNVAAGGRQLANFSLLAKHSPVVAALPQGVPQAQGQIAAICPDGIGQTMPSGSDEDGRQVVWCNAAFEADDDLRSYRSQDSASARGNRLPPGSCSNMAETEVSSPMRDLPATQMEDQQAWTSGISKVDANPSATSSPENVSFSPAISTASAVAGSSPATVVTKSPAHDSTLPHVAQLELEAAAGDWYTPVGSEPTSHSSRSCPRGNERIMDLSKTRRTLAAMPAFNAAAPTTSWNSNRHGPEGRATSSAQDDAPSSSSHWKSHTYFTEVPPNCESAGRRNSKRMTVARTLTPGRSCISDGNGPRGAKRAGRSTPVSVGKMNPRALNLPRNSTPKQQRFQHDTMVEADLEADIEHEIEEEISKEILHLSQRLAALHARQETRRVGGDHDKSKTGGMSCPQTPLRSAPSPSTSDCVNKRRGRVVAAKFLQFKNDGSNVKQGPEKSAAKLLGFNEGPFLGRPNPPRRSLGTPARLLVRDRTSSQQRTSSTNHMLKEELTTGRPPGSAATKKTVDEFVRERALESGSKRVAGVSSRRDLGEAERKDCNQWNDRGVGQSKTKDHQTAPSLSTGSGAVQSHFCPEFERKVDWVKSLRSGPLPAAHLSGMVNSAGPALDDRFLKQKSERQDIRAWLRENMGEAEGNGEIPSFAPISGTGTDEGAMPQEVHEDVKKMRMMDAEDSNIGVTPFISARPSNGWSTPLHNAGTSTPNRFTPNGKSTPSSGNARSVPSRYGTPVKATRARTPTPGSRCFGPTLILESQGAEKWYSQTSPRKQSSKEIRGGFPMRKVSPTTRKGYPGASGVRNGCVALGPSRKSKGGGGQVCVSKHERGVHNNDELPKVERRITVVEAEYEKFVQEGVRIEKQGPEDCATPVIGGHTGQGGATEGAVSKTPPFMGRHRDVCEAPSSASKPAKKIFIRCSDLIKDKHSLLMKGKQRRFTGQSVLPSECQDSDDSVFARSNTRTDSSELDENNSRSEEASIIEESTDRGGAVKQCQLFSQRGDVEEVQFVTGSIDRSEKSRTPDYDIVYEYQSGDPGMSYLPDDYTLEMMLQYVDTLKSEREGLPRIRATKDVVDSSSPRDSGCIKRTKEGEGRAHFYFKAGGGGKVQVPKSGSVDNEGLSPNEIEGLDLESFWCLVGELEGPMIRRP